GSVIDYALNLGIANKGILIIPIGLAFGVLYYFTFYFLIVKKDIKLVGREDDKEFSEEREEQEEALELSHGKYEYMAKKILENVGGKANLVDYENCMTRLRLVLKDASIVDEDKIKQTGAHGIVKVDNEHVQVVVGPEVSNVYEEFKKQIEG